MVNIPLALMVANWPVMVAVSRASSSSFHGNWVTCRIKANVMTTNQCTNTLIIKTHKREEEIIREKKTEALRGKPNDACLYHCSHTNFMKRC